jgi:hypothetical protein
MDDNQKGPAPEIMLPVRKEEPQRTPPEIPPVKDAPQKERPLRADSRTD